jgi:hypothetical protein
MELFFLVPKIVAAKKYIDISRDEIERALNAQNGCFDFEWEEALVDDFHQEHFATLRLNIHCASSLMVGWTIALKLHNERIDGIDWHLTYDDPDGQKQYGWHRHEFDQREKRATRRVPTNCLRNAGSKADFLVRTLSELNISVSGADHGNYDLFTPESVIASPSE